jgi:hypothetical protein
MVIGKRLTVFVVFVLLLVLSCGCINVKTPPVTRQAPPAIFVDYQRTGGTEDLNDRLVIFDNGVAAISRKTVTREITLNQTELVRLTGFFDLAQFSMLENNYTASRGSASYVQYSVSYRGKTVKTEDSAIPPGLVPVINDLNDNTGGTVTETPQFMNISY